MAYIPYTYVPIGSEKKTKIRYTLPTGGVNLSVSDTAVSVGKCAGICNLDILSDRIRTRNIQSNPLEGFCAEGTLNGVCRDAFCDKLIFHVGSRLYAYDASDTEPSLIFDGLPDKKSLMCLFMSKLYIYCNTHVYSLDNEFVFTEENDVEAPTIYNPIVAGVSQSIERNDTPFNLVAPRITAEFKSTTSKSFVLPDALDTTRPVEVYKDDVLCDVDEYEIYENKIIINDSYAYDNTRAVKVVYFLLNPEEAGFEDFIGDSSIAVSFGGDSNGGTRIFFMGNSNKKGYYYKSRLQDPLYVGSDEYEIIGGGNEDITAVMKMYGDLMVFTASSVYRMGYSLMQDSTFFTVKEISSQTGCDCPGSVQLIDNRVVFANSKKGVFIIDSTEDTGEQNIKPISGNIMKDGANGFLDNSREDMISACSVDFDRKYILIVGERAYIWDYDTTPYRESGSYSAAQQRLCWYIYDGIFGSFFAEIGGKLVSLYKNGGLYIYVFSDSLSGTETQTVFESGISECFSPLIRKHVTDMSIKLTRESGTNLVLSLYADGEKYYERKLPERTKAKEKILIHLPKKALYGFGFRIGGTGAYEIEEITAEYTEISE